MHQHSNDEIQLRAYQLWEDRGRPWGTPDVDWFHAEHDLAETRDHRLDDLARQVGGIVGSAVAFVSGKLPHDNSPSE